MAFTLWFYDAHIAGCVAFHTIVTKKDGAGHNKKKILLAELTVVAGWSSIEDTNISAALYGAILVDHKSLKKKNAFEWLFAEMKVYCYYFANTYLLQ